MWDCAFLKNKTSKIKENGCSGGQGVFTELYEKAGQLIIRIWPGRITPVQSGQRSAGSAPLPCWTYFYFSTSKLSQPDVIFLTLFTWGQKMKTSHSSKGK